MAMPKQIQKLAKGALQKNSGLARSPCQFLNLFGVKLIFLFRLIDYFIIVQRLLDERKNN